MSDLFPVVSLFSHECLREQERDSQLGTSCSQSSLLSLMKSAREQETQTTENDSVLSSDLFLVVSLFYYECLREQETQTTGDEAVLSSDLFPVVSLVSYEKRAQTRETDNWARLSVIV